MKTDSFLKNTYLSLVAPIALAFTTVINLCSSPASALTFNFNSAPGIDPLALAGFIDAGMFWEELFTDDVTINIDIGFQALNSGVLGEANSTHSFYQYNDVRNALALDKTSVEDNTAVSNLPTNSSIPLLINRTSNHPDGVGSATPYLDNDGDANNTKIWMTNANAKALGLLLANNAASDASLVFSNLFNWDFDRSDGISEGAYDFVGIAAHEIGHALGFMSGVDVLDFNSSNTFFSDDQFPYVSTMDLFRFSEDSLEKGKGVIDWTASQTDKYFSVDGGTTKIVSFSTGEIHGDGHQSSHWKNIPGIGIMKPSSNPNELLEIADLDLRLFDVIGWNRVATTAPLSPTIPLTAMTTSITAPNNSITATSVPEPNTLVGLIGLAAGLLLKQSKRPRN